MDRQLLLDAWAAGVVDSDGCITIKKRYGGGPSYYTLHVLVAQSGDTLPPMLKLLHTTYGGSIDTPYYHKEANRKPRWMWTAAAATAEALLTRISPFMVQKSDQAALALEYRRTAMGRGNNELAASFYAKMKATKHYTKKSEKWRTAKWVTSQTGLK